MIYLVSNQKRIETDDIKMASIQGCLEYFKDKDVIEVDTETERCNWDKNIVIKREKSKKKEPKEMKEKKGRLPDPFTSKMLLLQLGNKDTQFVIDVQTVNITPLKPLFEDETKLKILCNAFFDIRFFFYWEFNIKNIYDIFIGECVLHRGKKLPKGYRGLKGMADRYLGINLNKEIRGQIHWRGLDTAVITYAGTDVMYMEAIKDKQFELIKELNLQEYLRLENRYAIDLARLSYNGFKINPQKWLNVQIENKEKLQKLHNELNGWAIQNYPEFSTRTLFDTRCDIKWTSYKQVLPLFQKMGVDTTIRNRDKQEDSETVSIKLLEKQVEEFPILTTYIKYKETQKEISTYGEKFLQENLNPRTQKIHSEFFQINDTGRISSSNPNLQNIPASNDYGNTHPLRLAFEPDKNNTFVVCDFSQQEPRITAEYSKDPYLIDFILNGSGDSHSLIATMISQYLLGEHIEVTKKNNPIVPNFHRSIRDIGKMINLGKDYGKTAFSIKDDLKISQEEAQKLLDIIDSKTPKKIEYFNQWKNFVEKYGYIRTDDVFCSRTYFTDYEEFLSLKARPYNESTQETRKRYAVLKGELQRFAQNNRIQGTGAAMTKLAHIYFNNEIEKTIGHNNAKIVNVIHDELVAECKLEYAEQVAKTLKESMEKAGAVFCKTIPMVAEPVITDKWNH